jgi:hypothetical protein
VKDVVRALLDAGGDRLYLAAGSYPEIATTLRSDGMSRTTVDPGSGMLEYVRRVQSGPGP